DPARDQHRRPGSAASGLQPRRHDHRRERLAAERRSLGGDPHLVERGRPPRRDSAGPGGGLRRSGGAGPHAASQTGRGRAGRVRTRWTRCQRHRPVRDQRGFRRRGRRQHRRAESAHGRGQRERWRHRPGASARRDRAAARAHTGPRTPPPGAASWCGRVVRWRWTGNGRGHRGHARVATGYGGGMSTPRCGRGRIRDMLRWLTAGESHGPALVAILEGLPADVQVTTADVAAALARRRLGYGRGARMKFEADEVTFVGGVRHGRTLGGPVAVQVANTEWPKWEQVMAADPVDPGELEGLARNAPLTRPRPGHADLAGMQKYGFDEARPVLERASARETAARVALGCVAAAFLQQAYGVRLVSHTVELGTVAVPAGSPVPGPDDVEYLDADPLRCFDADTSAAMVAEVDAARRDGDTLGGVVEVVVHGLPPGIGS